MRTQTKNRELIPGLNRYSRSRMFQKRGVKYVKNTKHEKTAPAPAPKKSARFYPVDVAPKPLRSNRTPRPTKLRASITPGTVLIVLLGPYQGKRVVCLKQLPSGLLLVTGPMKINGVPMRRMNQTAVIATSTKIDVSKVDVSAVDDSMFQKPKASKTKKSEKAFLKAEGEEKKELPQEVKDLQKKVDASVLAAVTATPLMKQYLRKGFTLSRGQKPHLMKF